MLTTGGHNAGIVSPPGQSKRRHRALTREADGRYRSGPVPRARRREDGSWWPGWQAWLARHSGRPAAPPGLGAPQAGYVVLADAPGRYVLMR